MNSNNMPIRIKDDIMLSKNVTRCLDCNKLKMVRFLGDKMCDECEIEYNKFLNKIINRST